MNRFPTDTKIITPPLAPWMRWFLESLGIQNRIVETNSKALRVERFYFSSPSSMTGCWNPCAVDFLRHSFLPFASPASNSLPKRFYILREGYTRGLANEMEVRSYFESHGWSLIAPERLSIPDQIALFRDAEEIAGLHGSALTNLVWCSPGTHVIEILTKQMISGAFEWLSRLNLLDHRFTICGDLPNGSFRISPHELHAQKR
jgi:capsular polysaccharide biosynthesis protein